MADHRSQLPLVLRGIRARSINRTRSGNQGDACLRPQGVRANALLDLRDVREEVRLPLRRHLAVELDDVNVGATVALLEVRGRGRLELLDVWHLLRVEEAGHAPVDVVDLEADLERVELALLERLDEAHAAQQLLLRDRVQVRAELGEFHHLGGDSGNAIEGC